MLCEVLNAVFLTYIGTEYLTLSNRDSHCQAGSENHVWKVVSSKTTLIGACVVGTVNLMLHYGMSFWTGIMDAIEFAFPIQLVTSGVEASIIIGSVYGLVGWYRRRQRRNDDRDGCSNDEIGTSTSIEIRRLLPFWILSWVILYVQPSHSSTSLARFRTMHVPRILFAAVVFISSLYADCRRVLPSLSLGFFLRRLMMGVIRVAPVYPFLVALLSFAFLFLVSIFEAFNIPTQYLNMPIYYGCLYGPFSAVYWSVKSRLVIEKDDYQGSLPTTQQYVQRVASYEAAMRRAEVS